MCSDYNLINYKPKSNHYSMPILKELFDVLKFFRIFIILDFRFYYY